MSKYNCEIVADSISNLGHRLTTFKVTYPRIIHAEMCRHRILSRNTASSRAIPFEKMVKDVQENPFIPLAWQKDHKGMQGSEYFDSNCTINGHCRDIKWHTMSWEKAKNQAVVWAKELNKDGVTKQLCNRLLEPFVWTTELVSGTEWENFFSLRCPRYVVDSGKLNKRLSPFKSKKDAISEYPELIELSELEWLEHNESQAEIHIQKIAEMMFDCYNESKPKTLQAGEWHIPYGDTFWFEEKLGILAKKSLKTNDSAWEPIRVNSLKLKIATARAARISYTTLGDNPKIDYEADIKLHDRLLESKHLSCFEHCAKVMSDEEYQNFRKGYTTTSFRGETRGWCNNYRGFIQYRYLIENQ
jgi:thymidylate synthase ThyX